MRKTTKIDMHVHTKGSDGWGTPHQIAQNAVKAGLDGLVITDHHHTWTSQGALVADACRRAGLLVFRGCEYSTKQGHLLVYGVDADELKLGKYPDIQYAIDAVVEAGGAAVPAHPYKGYKRALRDEVLTLKRVRSYEVQNGNCAIRYADLNELATHAAIRKGKLGTGGSDAHDPRWLGATYTKFEGWVDTEKRLIQALRQGFFHAMRNRALIEQLAAEERLAAQKSLDFGRKYGASAPSSLDSLEGLGHRPEHGANHSGYLPGWADCTNNSDFADFERRVLAEEGSPAADADELSDIDAMFRSIH